MGNSVLFNYFINTHLDDSYDIRARDIRDKDIIKKRNEIISLIGEINKEKIDKLINAIISYMERVEYKHLIKIMHHGVRVGLEVQSVIDKHKYENIS